MPEKKGNSKKDKTGQTRKKVMLESSDKPKSKKAKVIETVSVGKAPQAQGLPESILPQQSSKKLKKSLKALNSTAGLKNPATPEVDNEGSIPNSDSKSKRKLSGPAEPHEAKAVELKSKSSKSCAPTVPTPQPLDGEDEFLLKGFETEATGEADDSSDEDDNDEAFNQTSEFDPRHLPMASNCQKTKQKKDDLDMLAEHSGVVYLGRIPHGFHEKEMTDYFSQFGETLRVKLSRNRRTGKSKHYAFIEFKHREVAQIVAETLQNYLLCGNMLQCKLLDKDEVHSRLWVGSGRKFRRDWKPRLAREKHNQPKSDQQQKIIADRLIKRETAKRKRMEERGIVYDFPGYCSTAEPIDFVKSSKKKTKALHDTESVAFPTEAPPIKSSDTNVVKGVGPMPTGKSKSLQNKKKARKSK